MKMLIIGNLFSTVGACFTFASSWTKDTKKIYLFQAMQCFSIAIANIFFCSYSGVVTLLLCASRNILVAYKKFNWKMCTVFLILIAIAGITSNNRGWIGLIPVITTIIYTIGCYLTKKLITIKINVITNLLLWAVYDIFVLDIISLAVDVASAILAVISLIQSNPKIRDSIAN